MLKRILLVFVMLAVLVACKKENTKENTIDTVETTEEVQLKNIAFDIAGMTCEVGCAGTIQKKLEATEGVGFVDVNFEAARAVVGFDPNVLSTDEIVDVVEGIAGGELYKVSNVKPYDGKSCCKGKCECKGGCKHDSMKCKMDSTHVHAKACHKDSVHHCHKEMKKCCAKDSIHCCHKGMKPECMKSSSLSNP